MADYSPAPPHSCQASERRRIAEAERKKKLTILVSDMGFSETQAKGLLEMSVEPDAKVKTRAVELFPGQQFTPLVSVMHKNEEVQYGTRWVGKGSPCSECGTEQYHRLDCPNGCPGCHFDGANVKHNPAQYGGS